MPRPTPCAALLLLPLALASCGGSSASDEPLVDPDAGALDDASLSDASDDATLDDAATVDATPDAAVDAPPVTQVSDPTKVGPFAYAEFEATTKVAATNNNVTMHCAFPTAGPVPAPWPLVLFAHGFQIAASAYTVYVQHLATYGYVACTVDYNAPFIGISHVKSALELSGAIDWALSAAIPPALIGKIDASRIGMSGHSLGGKLSIMAAKSDPRIKASLTLDPVDAATFCNPTDCPDATSMLPLGIPTGFLGETTDQAAGLGGQACAPTADNFQTFFAAAGSPSLQVTVNGANHISFVPNTANCLTCGFCQAATATPASVVALSKGYLVAFYQRWLRGDQAWETWLTGPDAIATWVTPGAATYAVK